MTQDTSETLALYREEYVRTYNRILELKTLLKPSVQLATAECVEYVHLTLRKLPRLEHMIAAMEAELDDSI